MSSYPRTPLAKYPERLPYDVTVFILIAKVINFLNEIGR